MDLEIFNKNLVFLGIVDNFEVLNWHRKYYTAGSFELTCPLTPDNLELLKKENVIYKSNCEAGFIHYRNIKLDREGKEVLYIKGSFLTALIGRRIIWGQLCFNGKVEDLYRKIINDNCINPSDINRKISLLKLSEIKNYLDDINYQNSYGNVLNELESLAISTGIGYRVNLNYETLQMEFEVYKGLDRTDNQNVNNKALFSRQYENILEQDYTESIGDYKNTCLIAGAGDGANRRKAITGVGSGLDRHEMYVDARDISDKEIIKSPKTDEVTGEYIKDNEGNIVYEEKEIQIPDNKYIPMLVQRGSEKLGEHKSIESFDSVVNMNQLNLVYKKDYDLGDIVTIFDEKWNITLDSRITEIQEIYQNGGMDVNAIFGDDVPSIYNKLKRM